MRNILLRAKKRCGCNKPGEEFKANSVEAKALVAISHAEYVTAEEQGQAPAEPPASTAPFAAVEPLISKAIREQAEELGLNVAEITGTGANGRITRADVDAALAAKKD